MRRETIIHTFLHAFVKGGVMHTLNPEISSTYTKLVLVIEENSAVCDMLCWILETAHYRTATLSRWQEAFVWAANAARTNNLPILIVLDLSTSLDIDAIAVLAHFRTQWRAIASTTPPIIVLTTLENVYHDLTKTGESILRKPFHVNDLCSTIGEVLSLS